ncbi:hypothetical protein MKK69_04545 [Methylobacterium sp. J-026]|uniref:hypothetical protein n=1 Tax=Methylobacterium sp. J-026 TaxID=2836624 RepID=UPI001FB8A0C6|nr:hypothetical protein [Methylobacterium sp. J-026]MCJ2133337.1 hypothetical protein [Methylobacterium sp. J-026]
MPWFVASYDLKETHPDHHVEMLKQAANLGWNSYTRINNLWYRLPNTTFQGEFANLDAAHQALVAAASNAKHGGSPATLTKTFVFPQGRGYVTSNVKVPVT